MEQVENEYVYHYTSAQTLYHLLNAKRLSAEGKDSQALDEKNSDEQRVSLPCENLAFLATDIAALNDRTEYKEITNLISEVGKTETIKLMDETLKGIPFVISFSTLPDWLPMWLNYADDGRGVCLKFNKEALERNLIKDHQQKAQPTNPVGVCKSLTQKHVAKRYMIAEKLLPLHHESYQQYKYV